MDALVIGRNGQLACELQKTLPKNINLTVLGSQDIDITNLSSLIKSIEALNPDVIINASAYTAVDKAESDSEQAYLINEIAVANLAKVAKQKKSRLIHVSTDFVFDGTSNIAYNVDDDSNPQSVYGASKLAGEIAIQNLYPDNSVIVRTSWVYSSYGNNFVKTMLRLMREKKILSVVSDQIGCPTYAKGLAEFIWCLVEQSKVNKIYHWSDSGVASWYDFAVSIQNYGLKVGILDKRIPIKPIKSIQYPTPAKRPIFSLLDSKTSQTIKESSYWCDNLEDCLTELKDIF